MHRKSKLIRLSSTEDSPLVRAILSGFSQPCTSVVKNVSKIKWLFSRVHRGFRVKPPLTDWIHQCVETFSTKSSSLWKRRIPEEIKAAHCSLLMFPSILKDSIGWLDKLNCCGESGKNSGLTRTGSSSKQKVLTHLQKEKHKTSVCNVFVLF